MQHFDERGAGILMARHGALEHLFTIVFGSGGC